MNMWGFTGGFMKELVNRFPVFLQKNIPENPLKCEYFLPFVVDELLKEKESNRQSPYHTGQMVRSHL